MDRTALDAGLAELVAALDGGAAPGCSAVLYGSAVRGDWVAGRSDVNLLLVVEDASPDALTRLTPAIAQWHERGFTPPLLIARDEWRRATDVFPVEITDIRLAYRVLLGPDPLDGLVVVDGDLRRALEASLRGKLVHLRQAWARFSTLMPVLGGFASTSLSELLVLLRATAVLLGRRPGETAAETISGLADLLGPAADAVRQVAEHRRDREWSCPPEVFAMYLEAVRRAVLVVDTHQPGAH